MQMGDDLKLCPTCTAGLMEILPVDPGCVVIRGAATTRFLCMEGAGRLYSSVRILYNINHTQ